MEWVDDLNRAMGYIEENLAGRIDLAEIARLAACSQFHLQRMFPYLCGMTLSDYIRRRRMSLAALDLVAGERVIDVALRYGYESPTSFARAFRDVHGVAPSDAQRGSARLTQHPRLTFTMQVRGEEAMEYRIVDKPAMRVVGYHLAGSWDERDAHEKIVEFWDELVRDGGERIHRVLSLMDGHEPQALMGVCGDDDDLSGYLVGVATEAEVPMGMTAWEVPAATYAVFDCVGPASEAIGRTMHRIMTEWLPSSGYERAPKADVEVYLGPNMTAADYRSQVWLPIERHRG